MQDKTYLYKIVDQESGNSLDGFKTEAEARTMLYHMKEGIDWKIQLYEADQWETNY